MGTFLDAVSVAAPMGRNHLTGATADNRQLVPRRLVLIVMVPLRGKVQVLGPGIVGTKDGADCETETKDPPLHGQGALWSRDVSLSRGPRSRKDFGERGAPPEALTSRIRARAQGSISRSPPSSGTCH